MHAVLPQVLTILNDSVPENDAPLWNASTAYSIGDPVIDKHYIYRAVAANTGKRPSENRDIDGAAWRTVGPTNKYACIDLYNYTQTVAPEGSMKLTIVVPFQMSSTTVGLLNMVATAVSVSLALPDGEVVWESGVDNLLQDSESWWHYCFGKFNYTGDHIFTDIAPVEGELTITLTGGAPAIGNIIVGETAYLGWTQYGAEIDAIDYSVNETNDYGDEILVKRQVATTGSFPVVCFKHEFAYISQRLSRLASTPTLWVGDDNAGFPPLLIFGFLKRRPLSVAAPEVIKGTYDIRGIK